MAFPDGSAALTADFTNVADEESRTVLPNFPAPGS